MDATASDVSSLKKQISSLEARISAHENRIGKDAVAKNNLDFQLRKLNAEYKVLKKSKEVYKTECMKFTEKKATYDAVIQASAKLEASPAELQRMLNKSREQVCKTDVKKHKLKDELVESEKDKHALEAEVTSLQSFIHDYTQAMDQAVGALKTAEHRYRAELDRVFKGALEGRGQIARRYGVTLGGINEVETQDQGKRKKDREEHFGEAADATREGHEAKKLRLERDGVRRRSSGNLARVQDPRLLARVEGERR